MIPLGITAMLCLGTVYAWSIFRTPLERELSLSATASLLPYTVSLVCYAGMMPMAGRWISAGHGRAVATTGSVVVGLGYLLASAAGSIQELVLAYGVVAGLGVGLTVTGFGLSPLITAPLAQRLIEAFGTRPTLRLFGLAFGAILLLAARLLRPAPPAASAEPATTVGGATTDLSGGGRRAFTGLWLTYALATLAGLSAIGIASPVGIELIGISPAMAAASVSLFAVFNGLSRPLFGWLCDRWNPARAGMLAFALILCGSLLMLRARQGDVALYLLSFCFFWSALGGWLAIAPATTLRCFPPHRYAEIYGLVFTAYGVGALMGTLITGQLRDWFGTYSSAFQPLAALALVGLLLSARLLPGKRHAP